MLAGGLEAERQRGKSCNIVMPCGQSVYSCFGIRVNFQDLPEAKMGIFLLKTVDYDFMKAVMPNLHCK